MYIVLFCNYSEEMDHEMKVVFTEGKFETKDEAIAHVAHELRCHASHLEVKWEVDCKPYYWKTITYGGVGFFVIALC